MLFTNASNFCDDTYCPLLKKMQLTSTAWVESRGIRDDVRGVNIQMLSKT
jgi:hypothetical protein